MKVIRGLHLRKHNEEFIIKNKKAYSWIVPKKLEKDLNTGDIVLVNCQNTKAPVLVLNIFDTKDKNLKHKQVIKIIEKNKKE